MITIYYLFLFFLLTSADEISDCKCKEGFSAQKDEHGNVFCQGIVLKSILPCNIVFKPDCLCGTEATSVVQDSSGTWCGRFVDGKEDRRWECQNKSEWETFYQEHPEERPKQTDQK